MIEKQPIDAIDLIIAQWARERPDLDITPMAVIGRLSRAIVLIKRELDKAFSIYGITNWEFDVLATLRRAGAPYCLAPTALFSTLMITSGTMTNRLQRLESSGLIQRIPNESDARSMLVQLTTEGFELIEKAIEAHVENEHRILAPMLLSDQEKLDQYLRKLLIVLDAQQDNTV